MNGMYGTLDPGRAREAGAALAVSLIMLLVMTLIGITSMGTTNLEEKMAGNTRDRAIAFQAAESALREAERVVQDNHSALSFDTTCTSGYCDCSSTSTTCPEYWTDTTLDVWNNVNRYTAYTVNIDNVAARSKYIIEYLGSFEVPSDPVCPTCPKQYYRITALGIGMSPDANVMLQSTYRID
jgi:type IV pilus assembly protein PilX